MTNRRGTGWRRMARLRRMTLSRRIQLVLGATLEGGGRACFDDVRLEVLP